MEIVQLEQIANNLLGKCYKTKKEASEHITEDINFYRSLRKE